MYGRVSFGKAFCLPPDSVVTVIELLIYVTILYSKYKILSNNLTIEFVVISEQSLKILICCINFTYLQSLVAEFRSMD